MGIYVLRFILISELALVVTVLESQAPQQKVLYLQHLNYKPPPSSHLYLSALLGGVIGLSNTYVSRLRASH